VRPRSPGRRAGGASPARRSTVGTDRLESAQCRPPWPVLRFGPIGALRRGPWVADRLKELRGTPGSAEALRLADRGGLAEPLKGGGSRLTARVRFWADRRGTASPRRLVDSQNEAGLR
jgi:hypothetical protein